MKIGIIGLGYVGLPLAVLFAKKRKVIGFDISEKRVAEISQGIDATLEVDEQVLKAVLSENEKNGLVVGHHPDVLEEVNFYIITVPTPIDQNKNPDLRPLESASKLVGKYLKKGDIVVYESTTYPGCTEEYCVPIIEKTAGLKFNEDFFVGYSPERINPGDKEHTVEKILKVTSGSTPEIAKMVDEVYASVIEAGTFLATSIKVAEAAKVIENTQRDINIAFVNELAKIFNQMGIDTQAVLDAAGTKWNFLPFKPGLVGGHCIGVDPYYLAQKAQEIGYHPEMILAGRRINDTMGAYIAGEVVKLMIKKEISVKGSRLLVLGITFKENCPDIRNSKVIDVITGLKDFGIEVEVYDPWANKEEVRHEFGIELLENISSKTYDSVLLAVAHQEFLDLDVLSFTKEKSVIYDVKGFLPIETDACL